MAENRDSALQVAQPLRMPPATVRRLVEAWQRRLPQFPLPLIHADDALALLEGDDADVAAATALFESERVFYPPNHEIAWKRN